MVINIKKVFLCLLFLFNIMEVDSNDNKNLFFDRNNLYEENSYKVYLNNVNSNDLEKSLDKLNIRVLSYIIENEKYYANNIDELIEKYLSDKSLNEKIYYENNGIIIDAINVVCQNSELLKLEEDISVF